MESRQWFGGPAWYDDDLADFDATVSAWRVALVVIWSASLRRLYAG